jgi:hypothetical protein
LYCTYDYPTSQCAREFINSNEKWWDETFFQLFDGIISNGRMLRKNAAAPFLLTNFVDRIVKNSKNEKSPQKTIISGANRSMPGSSKSISRE